MFYTTTGKGVRESIGKKIKWDPITYSKILRIPVQ